MLKISGTLMYLALIQRRYVMKTVPYLNWQDSSRFGSDLEQVLKSPYQTVGEWCRDLRKIGLSLVPANTALGYYLIYDSERLPIGFLCKVSGRKWLYGFLKD